MTSLFVDFDLTAFWEDSDYARTEYVDAPPSLQTVVEVESKLGYKLPGAYVALACHQNGGIPRNTCHLTRERTTWAADHVAVTGIYSIGSAKRCSLLGSVGSQFWVDEWGYPSIGVYFADCPSAGHDMFCLDYRDCGPGGEPTVVHVDQEWDYKITHVADNFEAFIRGLEPDEAFALEE